MNDDEIERRFEDWCERDLNAAVALNDEEVRVRILSALSRCGGMMETSPSAEDLRRVEELFKVARDEKQHLEERDKAARMLEFLGCLDDPNRPVERDLRFLPLGYIRVKISGCACPGARSLWRHAGRPRLERDRRGR
jgi:hypothetical protein